MLRNLAYQLLLLVFSHGFLAFAHLKTITAAAKTNNFKYELSHADTIAVIGDDLSENFIYISDNKNHYIRQFNLASAVMTDIAGTGTSGFSGDNISATSSRLNFPTRALRSTLGEIYIADQNNHRIRKVDTRGIITTYAGTGLAGFNGDNIAATSADLFFPQDIFIDTNLGLLLSDRYNNRIRRINDEGIITTIVGTSSGEVYHPTAIWVDHSHKSLFFSEFNTTRIRKIELQSQIVTTVNDCRDEGVDEETKRNRNTASPILLWGDECSNLFIFNSNNNKVEMIEGMTDRKGVLALIGNDIPNLGQRSGMLGQQSAIWVQRNMTLYAVDWDNNVLWIYHLDEYSVCSPQYKKQHSGRMLSATTTTFFTTNPPSLQVNLNLDSLFFNNHRESDSVDLTAWSANPSQEPTEVPTTSPTTVSLTMHPSTVPTNLPTSSKPSHSPTTYFSPEDCSSLLPAIAKTILRMNGLIFTATIAFNRTSCVAGKVFCYPAATNILVSASAIRAAGIFQSFAAGSVDVAISFNGLIPVSNYRLYCMLESTFGKYTSLEEIERNAVSFQTPCCKEVRLLNAPSYLYADPTKYLTSSLETVTFTYQLSHPPSENVSIIPSLHWLKGNETISLTEFNVSFLPPLITFLSKDTQLTGSFVIVCNVIVPQDYQLSFEYTGMSKTEYGSIRNHTLRILADHSLPPAPKLQSAVLDENGLGMYIMFASDTNSANFSYGAKWNCNEMLSFRGANNTVCTWLNSTTIRGIFGTNQQLLSNFMEIGDTVTLLPHILKAACNSDCKDYVFSSSHSLQLQKPHQFVNPIVLARVTDIVGSCDDIIIDISASTGSGGKSWENISIIMSDVVGIVNTTTINDYVSTYLQYNGNTSTIRIPASFLLPGQYLIEITLVNFFEERAKASYTMTVSGNAFQPKISIQYFSDPIITVAMKKLEIKSKVELPECGKDQTKSVTYDWLLLYNNGSRVSFNSKSLDPSVFLIPAQLLQPDNSYTLLLNVTSYAHDLRLLSSETTKRTILVPNGKVIARIGGGSFRQISKYSTLRLDASGSKDENSGNNEDLKFVWACTIVSLQLFGSNCNNIFNNQTSPDNKVIDIVGAETDVLYKISVNVIAKDERSGSISVTLQAFPENTPFSAIIKASPIVNIGTNMTLNAEVQSSTAVTAEWQFLGNGNKIPIIAYSPMTQRLSQTTVSSPIFITAMIGTDAFIGGSSITVRLVISPILSLVTAVGKHRQLATTVSSYYCQISFLANGSPWNGKLISNPTQGFALLSTLFSFQSIGWIDDESNYPLSYAFHYSLSPYATNKLALSYQSLSNTVTAKLPAGFASFSNQIYVQSTVSDSNGAFATANTSIVVTANKNINISDYLTSNIVAAQRVGDPSLVLQIVNGVASMINQANCTLIPPSYCASLHRYPCTDIAQTCGNCLEDDAKGIIGSSNTFCFPSNHSIGEIGSFCRNHSDCIYNYCDKTVSECSFPYMHCPSLFVNTICSGHGKCKYLTHNGEDYPNGNCTIDNAYCNAICQCEDGYGGIDCSLDRQQAVQRDKDRSSMCTSVTYVYNTSNPSVSLLDALTNSLQAAYDPYEIFQETSVDICQKSLTSLSHLSRKGYLKSTKNEDQAASSTIYSLIHMASKFVHSSFNQTKLPSSSDSPFSDRNYNSFITDTVSSIIDGVVQSTSNGQYPTSIVSDNIRLSTRKSLIQSMINSTIFPPQTLKEIAYGKVTPSTFFFVNDAASACDSGTGYADLSLMQWGTIPYPHSENILSPLLLFANKNNHASNPAQIINTTEPAYYVSFQFTSHQNFNRSIPIEFLHLYPNMTFPDCTVFDGQRYVACGSCNISSYTNDNVTYVCHDITQICSTTSSDTTDDYANNAAYNDDDSTGGSDDAVTLGSSMTIQQYAALFTAVDYAVVSVLSTDPIHISLAEAKYIISFVGSLFVVFLSGCVYFMDRDRWEMQQYIYSNQLSSLKQRKRANLAKTKSISVLSKNNDNVGDMIAKLLKMVVPNVLQDTTNTSTVAFLSHLMSQHDYTTAFVHKSTAISRFLRWFHLWKSIMIGLFIDTVFFQVFYSNTGECNGFTNKASCVANTNSITGDSQCLWTGSGNHDGTGDCSLNPPPGTITFTLVLALTCLFVGLPVDFVLSYVLDEYGCRIPNMELIGLSTAYWFGGIGKDDIPMSDGSDNESLSKLTYEYAKKIAKSNRSTTKAWQEYLSIEEEMKLILLKVSELYNHTTASSTNGNKKYLYKTVEKYTGISAADGIPSPLTVPEYWKYSNSFGKIEQRLELVREKMNEIDEELTLASVMDTNVQEMILLQAFLLEQFTPYQQWILQNQLGCFESFFNKKYIHPFLFLIVWCVLISCMLFFFYWVFAWSAANGSVVFSPWGINFAIGAIQDIFVIQMGKFWLFYCIAMYTVKPKLVKIQSYLQHVVIVKTLVNVSNSDAVHPAQQLPANPVNIPRAQGDNEVSHTSSSAGTSNSILHHFSPSCRLAWKPSYDDKLLMTRVLQHIDDEDIFHCNEISFSNSLWNGMLATIVIIAPLLLFLCGDTIAEIMVEIFFPTLLTGIVLLHAFLTTYFSMYWMIGFYIIMICMAMVYYGFVSLPAKLLSRHHVNQYPQTTVEEVFFPLNKHARLKWYMGVFYSVRMYCLYSLRKLIQMLFLYCNPIAYVYANSIHNTAREETWKRMNLPYALHGIAQPFNVQILNEDNTIVTTTTAAFPESDKEVPTPSISVEILHAQLTNKPLPPLRLELIPQTTPSPSYLTATHRNECLPGKSTSNDTYIDKMLSGSGSIAYRNDAGNDHLSLDSHDEESQSQDAFYATENQKKHVETTNEIKQAIESNHANRIYRRSYIDTTKHSSSNLATAYRLHRPYSLLFLRNALLPQETTSTSTMLPSNDMYTLLADRAQSLAHLDAIILDLFIHVFAKYIEHHETTTNHHEQKKKHHMRLHSKLLRQHTHQQPFSQPKQPTELIQQIQQIPVSYARYYDAINQCLRACPSLSSSSVESITVDGSTHHMMFTRTELTASKEMMDMKLFIQDFVWMIGAFCDAISVGTLSSVSTGTGSTATSRPSVLLQEPFLQDYYEYILSTVLVEDAGNSTNNEDRLLMMSMDMFLQWFIPTVSIFVRAHTTQLH